MDARDLVPYVTAVLALAVYPGVSVSIVVATAVEGRQRVAYAMVLGVLFANLIWIGISSMIRYLGILLPNYIKTVLPLLGSISLVLIGIRLTLSGIFYLDQKKIQIEFSVRKSFATGFFVHFNNPNTFVFFLSIFLSIVALDSNYFRNVFLLGSIAIITDMIILSSYIMIGNKISYILISPSSRLRHVSLISSIMLIFLGIKGILSRIGEIIS